MAYRVAQLRCHAEALCDVTFRLGDNVVMNWKGLARTLAITLLGLVALLLLIAAGNIVMQVAEIYLATKRAYNQVVLLNHAKETISQGEVRFGKRYMFKRLAAGDTALITIPTGGEGGYVIEVLFQSGRKLSSDELGYFTYGPLIMSDRVEIHDDKIILVNQETKKP
jgi:hypothetical protein